MRQGRTRACRAYQARRAAVSGCSGGACIRLCERSDFASLAGIAPVSCRAVQLARPEGGFLDSVQSRQARRQVGGGAHRPRRSIRWCASAGWRAPSFWPGGRTSSARPMPATPRRSASAGRATARRPRSSCAAIPALALQFSYEADRVRERLNGYFGYAGGRRRPHRPAARRQEPQAGAAEPASERETSGRAGGAAWPGSRDRSQDAMRTLGRRVLARS